MWNNKSCGCGQESPSYEHGGHYFESPTQYFESPSPSFVNPSYGSGGPFVSPSYHMCGHMCGHTKVAPAYYMDNQYSCGDRGYKGSPFVLIVVLFILLIIVGSVMNKEVK